MAWEEGVQLIDLVLLPMGPVADIRTYQLIDNALGGKVVGTLYLNTDQATYITQRFAYNQPSADLRDFQNFVSTRMSNPQNYAVNGTPLSHMPVGTQLSVLTLFFQQGKDVPALNKPSLGSVRIPPLNTTTYEISSHWDDQYHPN